MPELPEVETVLRGLNQLTLNQEMTGGDVLLERAIAYPFSSFEFISGIKGSAIATWHRRGKYLLAELTTQGDKEDNEDKGKASLSSPTPPLPHSSTPPLPHSSTPPLPHSPT
ncbi:MAG: DNA-formamidopyrimidine glycosylase, partial [Tolypothrix sp. Co-bin9]|nr:DNA-formamidopyrimidine glycosylase [Tolypothrix sp. Co-bin9]